MKTAKEEDNLENVYRLLHDFRNWNREWDINFSKHPENVDDFAKSIAKKYSITLK